MSTEKNNMSEHNEEIRKSFKIQAEGFESSSMNFTKQEFLDYTVRAIQLHDYDCVIEVAARTCVCGRSISPFAKEVTCLDITPEMLEIGRNEAEKQGLTNMNFVLGDAETIPFPDGSFDVAVSRLAFHHMLHPKNVFSEMKRVLKPSGKLVLIDMEAAEENLRETEDHIESMRDPSHVKNLSRMEMMNLYETEGMKILKCETTRIPVSLDSWMNLTKTNPAVRQKIRDRMDKEINGGNKTGFNPYMENGTIYFQQRWILLLGVSGE